MTNIHFIYEYTDTITYNNFVNVLHIALSRNTDTYHTPLSAILRFMPSYFYTSGGANKGRARPGGHVLINTKLRITGVFSYITASYFSYSTSTASVAIT